MMEWSLLIVAMVGGVFSRDVQMTPIPMRDGNVCAIAALKMAETSTKNIGFICISSVTGDVVVRKGAK